MSKQNDRQIESLLDEAERSRRCLVAASQNLARQLLRRAKKGELIRINSTKPLMYARANTWGNLSRPTQEIWKLRARNLACPSEVYCLYSAAALFGLAVSQNHLQVMHVIGHSNFNTKTICYHNIGNQAITTCDDVRCTTIERTLFDCARMATFPAALAIVDSALRLQLISGEHLKESFAAWNSGWSGAKQARRVSRYASPLAESGGESYARGLMVELGFAEPELQAVIVDPVVSGKHYRADFLWRVPAEVHAESEKLIIGEFDGREKYTNPEMTGGRSVESVLIDERLRESRIGVTGAKIMRFGYKDLKSPGQFKRLLEAYGVPRA